MTIEELRYFVTAANEKSFSAAAVKLFISPQGISQGIRHLEKELNVTLFERTATGVRLSEDGGELYGYAADIICVADNMLRTSRKKVREIKRLRCAVKPQRYADVLKYVIENFCRAENIEVNFVVHSTLRETNKLLLTGEADIAFCLHEEPYPNYCGVCRPIARLYSHLIINRNGTLASKVKNGTLTWKDLDSSVLVTEKSGMHKNKLNSVKAKYAVNISTKYCYSISYCIESVANNAECVFFAPDEVRKIAAYNENELLLVRLTEDPIYTNLIALVKEELSDNPVIDELLHRLSEYMADYSPL